MQTSPPKSQTEILNWMSIFLVKKLNQAAQNENWATVTATSMIIKAVVECMEEIRE